MALTLGELNRATLARQLLLRRERLDVVDAVRRIVAIQAQEPASPYIALWNRLDPSTRPISTPPSPTAAGQGDAHADHPARGGRPGLPGVPRRHAPDPPGLSPVRPPLHLDRAVGRGRRRAWSRSVVEFARRLPAPAPTSRRCSRSASAPFPSAACGGRCALRPAGPRPHRRAVVVRLAAVVRGRAAEAGAASRGREPLPTLDPALPGGLRAGLGGRLRAVRPAQAAGGAGGVAGHGGHPRPRWRAPAAASCSTSRVRRSRPGTRRPRPG